MTDSILYEWCWTFKAVPDTRVWMIKRQILSMQHQSAGYNAGAIESIAHYGRAKPRFMSKMHPELMSASG